MCQFCNGNGEVESKNLGYLRCSACNGSGIEFESPSGDDLGEDEE